MALGEDPPGASVVADPSAPDPRAQARSADLIGPNCAYTTGLVARRTLDEGQPWTYAGRLVPADTVLPSKVAAPYAVGPEQRVRVVANEVLEDIAAGGAPPPRVHLEGRLLEIEEVTYFVVTGWSALPE
jgi:hypothetical protein